jgi:hypothetical protein
MRQYKKECFKQVIYYDIDCISIQNITNLNGTIMIMKKHITVEEANLTGKRLGVKWDKFNVDQFKIGMEVELEHGTIKPLTNVSNDYLLTTGKITLAHLNEIPDYYTRLLKMEKEAKKQTKK